ncbi:ANTAR domain-containing protein [Streptomyces sp. NPDC088785]|uniref:ANTAR domain-containing protein n=1 Tax=Streptomyces sp. NPDC088785 TaxID=3365897 RepID=UPI0037F6B71F
MVVTDRMMGVLRLLEGDGWSDGAAHAVTEAAGVLGVDGIIVCLSIDGGSALEPMWFSDPAARAFSDLQFTCGQGPSLDSMRHCSTVRVVDLDSVREDRWPALTAVDTGPTRGVFCFPLRVGALRIGVMTLLRSRPGSLTGTANRDADLLARALTRFCLGQAADGSPDRPDPPLPGFLESGLGDGELPENGGRLERAEIHQATGMLSVQLRLPLPDALVRLRALAYTSGDPVGDVAHAIVTRRLRLDEDDTDDTDDDPHPLDDKDPPA